MLKPPPPLILNPLRFDRTEEKCHGGPHWSEGSDGGRESKGIGNILFFHAIKKKTKKEFARLAGRGQAEQRHDWQFI